MFHFKLHFNAAVGIFFHNIYLKYFSSAFPEKKNKNHSIGIIACVSSQISTCKLFQQLSKQSFFHCIKPKPMNGHMFQLLVKTSQPAPNEGYMSSKPSPIPAAPALPSLFKFIKEWLRILMPLCCF